MVCGGPRVFAAIVTQRVTALMPSELDAIWMRLFGGSVGAVEDAGGGADVHVQGDAVVGMAGHAGHVGGVKLPGEQGRGAEHVPQAVPGPAAVAAAVTPAGREVGGLEDLAAVVGGPPVLSCRAGKISPSGLMSATCSALACSRRAASRSASG